MAARQRLALVGLTLSANLRALSGEGDVNEQTLLAARESALDLCGAAGDDLLDVESEAPRPLLAWSEAQSQAELVQSVREWAREYPQTPPKAGV
jgi:hypothetical protein